VPKQAWSQKNYLGSRELWNVIDDRLHAFMTIFSQRFNNCGPEVEENDCTFLLHQAIRPCPKCIPRAGFKPIWPISFNRAPRQKGPALRLLTNTSLHFLATLLVCMGARRNFFQGGGQRQHIASGCWQAVIAWCITIIYTRVHNLFAIAGRVTFIFINYGRQRFEHIFLFLRCFCSASTHWA